MLLPIPTWLLLCLQSAGPVLRPLLVFRRSMKCCMDTWMRKRRMQVP